MKNLLIFAATLFAFTFMGSCAHSDNDSNSGSDTIDTIALEPSVEISPEITVVGEAYDGADRSIIIVTHDGDTVTIRYVEVRVGNSKQDSVIALLRGRH